jgi:hypothetical protein
MPPGRGVPVWREVAIGADVTRNSWSAYSTVTVAPLGALDGDGLRLRTVGGYGRYRYDGERTVGGRRVPTRFYGTSSFTDLLAGYQFELGNLTLKGFAGASGIAHQIAPLDRTNEVSGLDLGFKAVLEIWAEISASVWASADLSWTAAHDTYGTRLRSGWRVMPELSLGVEGGTMGNSAYNGVRAGGFIRYAPDWGEISLSGGVTGDVDDPSAPYATISWSFRY